MFCMERNCLSVSGSRHARTRIVRAMIDVPHPSSRWSWKKTRIASKKSISGWSGFEAIGGTGVSGV